MADVKVNNLKIRGSDGNLYEFKGGGNNDELLAKIQTLESELTALKEQVASGGNVDTSNLVKKDELDEFDPDTHKQALQNVIDTARNELLTIDKFDEFDPNAYKTEISEMIETGKAELLTIDKFDEFDTNAYETELNTIIEGARAEFAILDSLDEIDIEALKAEIKADILAEIGGA